ncbi:amidohydrolase [Asticcacaulis sp. BYS171W]|uniref:Amidohydrolase n=1 Tax=Asticcacaulis aquaticus TaxID=2984212 RepID=A0ABT5HX23_9CAUL|nr:amidohydrolase [Asticcacaulis aquaticus]MDC7684534.1 amidohydrolase [Asticcacaulis aquaticus]
MMERRRVITGLTGAGLLGLSGLPRAVQAAPLTARIAALAAKNQPKVVAWRRDIHEHPELGNREVRTAALVAAELRRLGLEVHEKIALTGVVGVLKGDRPGPAVALRADMDALPVLEKTGLPFASKATGDYDGKTVPITHACGHDAHVAMLLGAAEVLTALKADIAGSIVFIFQPAEEGPPPGEKGGADLMVAEGVIETYRITSIFGLHVWPKAAGKLYWRPKGFMAAADRLEIRLSGRQTHGAQPWNGVDITALASDIVGAVNQIAARQIDVTAEPTVLSITTMQGGVRFNIIPEDFKLGGTLRTFSEARRADIHARVTKTVEALAQAYGAKAEVEFTLSAPLTYNDPKLSADLIPVLARAAGGADRIEPNTTAITGAEDFSQFQKKVPGVFAFLGTAPPNKTPEEIAPNHSPYFDIFEPAMETGVRAHAEAALFLLGWKA